MRSPRLLMLLAVVLGLVLLLAACGEDDVADEPEEPDDDEEVVDDEPEDDEEAPEDEEAAEDEEPADAEELDADVEAAGDLCEGDAADVEAPEGYTVGLVTDIGNVDDGTFNQYAYEGQLAAAECFGIDESDLVVVETQSEADYDRNISSVLAAEPDVVITVGFLLQDATEQYAQDNPDVNFIGVDQFSDGDIENFVGLQFREDQGGFLAGAMAALMTESNVIAAVGGPEEVPAIPRFLNGYAQGAAHVDEGVNVLDIYLTSFNDPAEGRSAAEQFLGEGADVVFGAAGVTGSGAIQAAAESDAWVIGVDQDEYYTTFGEGDVTGADRIVTSAVKRVDVGVFEQIRADIEDTFEPGNFTLDAANEGITYAPFHDADVPDDVADQIEEVRQGLADESIETGVDPATGELLE